MLSIYLQALGDLNQEIQKTTNDGDYERALTLTKAAKEIKAALSETVKDRLLNLGEIDLKELAERLNTKGTDYQIEGNDNLRKQIMEDIIPKSQQQIKNPHSKKEYSFKVDGKNIEFNGKSTSIKKYDCTYETKYWTSDDEEMLANIMHSHGQSSKKVSLFDIKGIYAELIAKMDLIEQYLTFQRSQYTFPESSDYQKIMRNSLSTTAYCNAIIDALEMLKKTGKELYVVSQDPSPRTMTHIPEPEVISIYTDEEMRTQFKERAKNLGNVYEYSQDTKKIEETKLIEDELLKPKPDYKKLRTYKGDKKTFLDADPMEEFIFNRLKQIIIEPLKTIATMNGIKLELPEFRTSDDIIEFYHSPSGFIKCMEQFQCQLYKLRQVVVFLRQGIEEANAEELKAQVREEIKQEVLKDLSQTLHQAHPGSEVDGIVTYAEQYSPIKETVGQKK